MGLSISVLDLKSELVIVIELKPLYYRCNASQCLGGRPFWSQRHHALYAQEGQPDQHAHPEGPLLHQKALCIHPQLGVHVEAGLG